MTQHTSHGRLNLVVPYLLTRFSKNGSLPTTGLVSFPGSGNTWIRYLIEGATGIFTGSFYRDVALFKNGKQHDSLHTAYTYLEITYLP